jgi:hypothetical protein
MVKYETGLRDPRDPARQAVKLGTCDWCYESCPADTLTVISSAKLCQGCAPFYLGDEEDEEEDEK